jgi:hypothetical protein
MMRQLLSKYFFFESRMLKTSSIAKRVPELAKRATGETLKKSPELAKKSELPLGYT